MSDDRPGYYLVAPLLAGTPAAYKCLAAAQATPEAALQAMGKPVPGRQPGPTGHFVAELERGGAGQYQYLVLSWQPVMVDGAYSLGAQPDDVPIAIHISLLEE